MEPTESQRLLASEFCRNWIASGHAVERMAQLLADEHAMGTERVLAAAREMLTDATFQSLKLALEGKP